jgi:hypothetical protein
LTLSELLADLYRRFGYASSPASEVTTRFTALLNETQAEILSRPGLESLLHGSLTFASVASTPTYALPQAVARVKAIYEGTNDQRLIPQSLDWYRTAYPDTTAVSGVPDHFVDLGFLGVAQHPSDASEVFVDSTAAGDTNTAYIEGYRTGGYFKSLSVSMTGTTAVSLGAAIADFVLITKFYLSAAAVGTVTLHEDASGGTELARIPIGQTHARYRRIALAPTPASVITYNVDFEWDPQNMANAMDEPVLPPRFHRLIGIGTRMKEFSKKDDTRYRETEREFTKGLNDLHYFVASGAHGMPVMGQPAAQRPSRLGGWYPAGS